MYSFFKKKFKNSLNCFKSSPLITGNNIIKRYSKITTVGQGSFGTIFMVNSNKGKIAIKEIRERRIYNRELKSLSKLRNIPSIINIIDYWSIDNLYYIAFKYYIRGDLFDVVKFHSPVSENQARKIFIKLLEPIRICHMKNIIHCDIKTENFLIDNEKQSYVLIDFGMAHEISTILDTEVIPINRKLGTRRYSPPETWLGLYGKATDVWGLGTILFQLLQGKNPYNLPENKQYLTETDYLKNEEDLDVSLSRDAYDLLDKLLSLDYSKRLTINEIYFHPWIKNI